MAELQQQRQQHPNYSRSNSMISNNHQININSTSFNPRSQQINVAEFVDTSTARTTTTSSYNVATITGTAVGEGSVRQRRAQLGARSYRVVAKPPPKPQQPRPYFNGWDLLQRDLKQKKRMARYKAFAVEGQLKASLRSSLSWFMSKYYSG